MRVWGERACIRQGSEENRRRIRGSARYAEDGEDEDADPDSIDALLNGNFDLGDSEEEDEDEEDGEEARCVLRAAPLTPADPLYRR